MYISDSLNLLTNIVLKAIAGEGAASVDMRYADIISPTKKEEEPKKQETAEEVVSRITEKLKGGK